MSTATIKIKNCNNIKECEFEIEQNILNIKYANNGTGKSTISKALKLYSDNKALDELKPFKSKTDTESIVNSSVENVPYNNIFVFNEDYLKTYVYQKSELLKNTFEIMIETDAYKESQAKIDEQVKTIKDISQNEEGLFKVKEITKSICSLLELSSDKKRVAKRKKAMKSVIDNKKGALFTIPEELIEFQPFIDDDKSIEWANWKLQGISLFDSKGICPYCAETDNEQKKEKNELFNKSFDKESIDFSSKLSTLLTDISEYVNADKLKLIMKLLAPLADKNDLELELVRLSLESEYLSKRLFVLSSFNGHSIDRNNMDNFEEKFNEMKINEESLNFFTTDAFMKEIRPLNEKISNTLDMIGVLKGEVAKFQDYLNKHVASKKDDVNSFLKSAGFNYVFDIDVSGDNEAKAILKYIDEDGSEFEVNNPEKYLSWGEKNVFALLLFMFDAISKNADLIILDDPISSFDSNKKYAIINRLFKTGSNVESLYQKTVLMLTHDLEPIIDYIQVGGRISGDSIKAHYMNNIEGILTEGEIKKNEGLMSTVVLLKEIACDNTVHTPIRLACIRKYVEHTTKNPKDNSYAYNLLSSLIHGREAPTKDSEGVVHMSQSEIENGVNELASFIENFNYNKMLTSYDADALLNLYEAEHNDFYKFLLLRAYIERNEDARKRLKKYDDVLRKYVDETYHIENDYIYTLDFRKFDIIPQHYKILANEFIDREKTLMC